MASVRFSAITGSVHVDADETVAQLTAAANKGVLVEEINVTIDPDTETSDYICDLQLLEQTDNVNMTATGTSIAKINFSDDESLQSTVFQQNTGEPAGTDIVGRRTVHIPASGITTVNWRFARGERKITGGQSLGVKFIRPSGGSQSPNVKVNFVAEE